MVTPGARPRRVWRGSALLITVIILMVMFTLGSALLNLTTTSLFRSQNDLLRAQSLDVAEAGVEKAIFYLRGTAPANSGSNVGTTDGTANGNIDGSWRTASWTETLSGAGTYTFSIANGTGDDLAPGKVVIISTGTATLGSRSRRRTLRVVLTYDRENVSVWNNVIFGGVGQAGQSINGNVVMRGSVHILGEGEPYTDVNGNGHYDSSTNGGTYAAGDWYIDSNGVGSLTAPYTGSGRLPYAPGDPFCEPFTDLNGNGVWDPPLTVTDLAQQIDGTANIGNNYNGMAAAMAALIPPCPTVTTGSQTLQSLSAKLRVKHGQVSISGTATVGMSSNSGTPPAKGNMDGCYVSDGYTGNKGAANVYSDNGTSRGYDLGNIVSFPDVTVTPETDGGVNYSNHMAYLADSGLDITGPLNLTVGTPYSINDAFGNSLSVDASGNVSVSGIVYVNGDINLNRGTGSTFTYSGRGTLAATGSIYVHTNVLPGHTFPTTDALGLVAQNQLQLATGSGDAQLEMIGAFYAQEQIVSQKQNQIAGSFVSSYYSMSNVPDIYQVPALATNLPPGMPGSTPIWVVFTTVNSWRETAGS